MKYQITQKLFALGGDYSVLDESGHEAYYFDGKVFNLFGKKVLVYDEQRKEQARIVQKPFAFHPTFRIKRNGVIAATIKKRALTVRDQFVIDVPGVNDYQVIGDYVGNEYTIRRGSVDVARVSKRFFGATDSYGVEMQGGDVVLLLCAVVVIDMVHFKQRKS